jgi:putative ABC transport system permease protein
MPRDIIKLMLVEFTTPVVIALLIGAPLAYIAMQRWLSGFAYRVEASVWLFVATFVGVLLLAWATVAFNSLGAARARPVKALRYE